MINSQHLFCYPEELSSFSNDSFPLHACENAEWLSAPANSAPQQNCLPYSLTPYLTLHRFQPQVRKKSHLAWYLLRMTGIFQLTWGFPGQCDGRRRGRRRRRLSTGSNLQPGRNSLPISGNELRHLKQELDTGWECVQSGRQRRRRERRRGKDGKKKAFECFPSCLLKCIKKDVLRVRTHLFEYVSISKLESIQMLRAVKCWE